MLNKYDVELNNRLEKIHSLCQTQANAELLPMVNVGPQSSNLDLLSHLSKIIKGFNVVLLEYLPPEIDWENYVSWPSINTTREAILYYFFIQAPQGRAPGTNQQLAYQEALANIREVRYDRGQLTEEKDREAQRMASAKERLHSFTVANLADDEVFNLANNGFYLVDSYNGTRLKCSFCKRVFNYGMRQSI